MNDTKTPMRKVQGWVASIEDGDEGYVTACRRECALDHAEVLGHTVTTEGDEGAWDEADDGHECSACGYPNPASMSAETKASLTPAERAYIEEGGGNVDPDTAPARTFAP